jgi:HSP20 family protein
MTKKSNGTKGIGGLLGGLGDLMDNLQNLHVTKNQSSKESGPSRGMSSFERILEGFSEIGERLNEISEKGGGEGVNKTGEFTFPGKEGGVKGVYGFTIKSGIAGGEEKIKVESFGNIKHDKKTGRAVVQEIREPLMDIFEEEEGTLLVIEMPGISAEDVKVEIKDDIIILTAEKGEKKYRKEVLLKHLVYEEKTKVTCNNGVIQIMCSK